jgi:hypothetical protein
VNVPEAGAARARLYGERRSSRKPVFGTTTALLPAPQETGGGDGTDETDDNGNGGDNGNRS